MSFAEIDWRGRAVSVEHQWIAPKTTNAPLIVFLHEGLGSLSMWKDFPERLCDAAQVRGLVYSRPGYGKSTPRAADEQWASDFMHRQAHEVLPALLNILGVAEPIWLFGHSDGGSIALLYAARFAESVAGAVVMAPHIVVEALSVTSIAKTREAYEKTDLRQRLSKYHNDPDSAFWGWNRIWLDPAFGHWSIERDLESITCPLLAMQGIDDQYGTLAQVHGIRAQVPHAQVLELNACGHSPHRDQAAAVIAATVAFLKKNAPRA